MRKSVISITKFAAAVAAAVAVSACEAEKSRNPLSPNVAGPIAGVSISPPTPVNPINGAEVLNTAPVRLVFNNGSTNGQRPLFYIVELASDAAFTNKVFAQSKVTPGSTQTSIVVDAALTADRTYFWRVKADDGANESEYSSVAKFDFVVPIVLEAPVPVSPVGGVVASSTRPVLVVNNAGVQGRAGRVEYWFEVALDQAFSKTIIQQGVERSSVAQTSAQMPELPGSTLLFWRVVGYNGTFAGPWSLTQTFLTPATAAPPVPPAPGPAPTPPGPPIPGAPGCVNGVLSDPRAYFFALIGRTEGSPAGDWASVLQRSGLPAGPTAGVRVPSNAPFYGLTQQINSSGQVRGRLFLPTDTPDAHGYYIHQVDVLSDASANHWVWRPLGGPQYVPRRCP